MEEETKNEGAQEEKQGEKEKPVEEMTVKELREVAKGMPGITGLSSMKKDQLLEAIKKAKEVGAEKEEAKEQEAEEEVAKKEEAKKEEGVKKEEEAKEGAKEEGEVAEKEEEKPEEKEKPLDKLTAKELREMARAIPGITGVTAMKKEQLLKIIKKARGIKEEAPVEKRKEKAAVKEGITRELKQKIILLKQEKEAARAANDRKKVDILRRRINRLKKKTRRVAQAA